MSLLRQTQPQRRRKTDREAMENQLERLSKQLCSRQELKTHWQRQAFLSKGSNTRVALFPVWRRYRWQAQQVVHLQTALPVLKRLPLFITTVLCRCLYQ